MAFENARWIKADKRQVCYVYICVLCLMIIKPAVKYISMTQ